MDLLKKCQSLYAELRTAYDALSLVETELKKPNLSPETHKDLYEREFASALQMSGAYEDLMYALEKLERERSGMEFYASRVRTNATRLVYSETYVSTEEL